ncbi:MAG: YraN family protein [Desulfobacteraceae bacterium 4572_123]|nr:MAG: YraN family protein [Desulfobacteraceae bacterium 4572_123]
MLNSQQQFGKESEALAVQRLKKKGYKILEVNYRTRLGEIDIIARDRRTIAFVEVKARRSGRYGSPKWAITAKKKRNLSMAALCYLKTTGQNTAGARFDVVSIRFKTAGPEVEIIKNAFELAYP